MPFNRINKGEPEASSLPERQHLNADMFKRKPKPEGGEGEPLVPHGMIWYATPEPPAEEKEDSLDRTVQYAQVIEMMRRARSQEAGESAEPDKENPSEAPAEIPWWRMQPPDDAVAQSKTQPNEIQPALPPPPLNPTSPRVALPSAQMAQIPVAVEKNEPLSASKREWALAQYFKGTAESITTIVSRLRSSTTEFRQSTAEVWARFREHTSQRLDSTEWKTTLRHTRAASLRILRTGAVSTLRYVQQSQSALIRNSRSRFGDSRRLAAKLVGAASTHAKEFSARTKLGKIRSPKLRAPRVRIVLTGLPLQIRIFFMRQFTPWRLIDDQHSMDSRLWISMTMAAITAIIALIIVSLVPHYAARFLPSRLTASQLNVSANSATVAPARVEAAAPVRAGPAAIVKPASAESGSAAKPPSKIESAKLTTAEAKTTTGTKRHHVDDDYVAPDTYKYYGNSDSAGR